MELVRTKLYAVMLILLGIASVFIEGDCTFFIFALLLGVTMLISKKNWIS
ncbi:hypothetical protein AGMMS49975_11920 [Clostridia bacterium]|nr:hypothetical protein AGMMS49975_11920 [Clostridia bacterium]